MLKFCTGVIMPEKKFYSVIISAKIWSGVTIYNTNLVLQVVLFCIVILYAIKNVIEYCSSRIFCVTLAKLS